MADAPPPVEHSEEVKQLMASPAAADLSPEQRLVYALLVATLRKTHAPRPWLTGLWRQLLLVLLVIPLGLGLGVLVQLVGMWLGGSQGHWLAMAPLLFLVFAPLYSLWKAREHPGIEGAGAYSRAGEPVLTGFQLGRHWLADPFRGLQFALALGLLLSFQVVVPLDLVPGIEDWRASALFGLDNALRGALFDVFEMADVRFGPVPGFDWWWLVFFLLCRVGNGLYLVLLGLWIWRRSILATVDRVVAGAWDPARMAAWLERRLGPWWRSSDPLTFVLVCARYIGRGPKETKALLKTEARAPVAAAIRALFVDEKGRPLWPDLPEAQV